MPKGYPRELFPKSLDVLIEEGSRRSAHTLRLLVHRPTFLLLGCNGLRSGCRELSVLVFKESLEAFIDGSQVDCLRLC
jgi:hypothetical protein